MQRYFTFFLVLLLSLLLSACMPVMEHARAMIEHGKMHHWMMDHPKLFHEDMNCENMNHEGMNHEGMNHEGMNHEGMNHEGMNHEGMNCEDMDCEGMNHEGMNHEGMNHEGMNHEGMNHEGMNHEGMNCEGMDCEGMNCKDMDCEGMNCKDMDCEGMNCKDMDCEGMNHEGMNHEGMNHGAMANGTIPTAATPFDAQFIDSMIEHHQGAIAMAKAVQAESERPELLAMAEAIIADQGKEIEQMQAWRAEWYPDLSPSAGMNMPMGQMSIAPDEEIPFDQRFLTAMIDHHQGAIHMAEMALAQADHEELTALSKRIIAAQTAEIEQMQEWLQTWFDVTP